LICLFQQILVQRKNPALTPVKALILVPTRELAIQIEEEAQVLGQFLSLKTLTVYGGVGYERQKEMLKSGVDIVICTPGRLLDLAGSGHMMLFSYTHLVIDEADRMLDMGFLPDIEKIIRQMSGKDKRQTMLFSATLDNQVKNIAESFMNESIDIIINPEQVTVDNIEQQLYHVARDEKLKLLLGLLKKYNPETVLIFANTKRMTEELARRLQSNGYAAEFIMGDLPQRKRIKIIDSIKDGNLKFLVATDVASRGLHINDLSLVVNYDLPENPENYVHRIGRTARAGKHGMAITLASERDVNYLGPIEALINMKIPINYAEEADYLSDQSHGMRYREEGSHREGRGGGRGPAPHRGYGQSQGGYRGRPERPSRSPSSHGASGGARHASSSQPRSPVHPQAQHTPQRASGHIESRPDQPRQHVHQANPPRHSETRHDNRQHPQHDNRPHGKTQHHERTSGHVAPPKKGASETERLAYYRQRYGEDFKIQKGQTAKTGRKGLIDHIKGIFHKKKK
jgi:ATP-dependent RNA helicase RhlB